MTELEEARLVVGAGICKALAHPTRLFIVKKLAEKPYCVCDLTAMIGADVSTVSKHLSVLRHAGVVNDDKQANKVFYKLKLTCVLRFLDCIEAAVRESAQHHAALLDEETI